MSRRLRVLHAIHDFLPRHRAGSEIYAFELARAQSVRHDVFVLAAEYDPAAVHGTLRWRAHDGLPVVEIVNNWECREFAHSYQSPRITEQLGYALDAVRPDVVHLHSLLNLSFALPRLARQHGAAVVATLHDYTLVCPSGGQRVHVAEEHVCETIDPVRCSRCFGESPFHGQMAAGRVTRLPGGRALGRAAVWMRRAAPAAMTAAATALDAGPVTAADIERRLADARGVFDAVDLFVAPSPSIAAEFVRLGLDPRRVEISDYGFAPPVGAEPGIPNRPETRNPEPGTRNPSDSPLRLGFVGTLVWHKGPHVLLEALRLISGGVAVHLHGDTEVFPDYAARLRRLASGRPVTFHGRFDRTELARIYDALDVLVVPSLWPENSPLVIHEAFMHGVAVVGARMGGIADLIEDDVNGLLVEPASASALAAALVRIVAEPGLRDRLAAAAPRVKTIAEDAAEWDVRYGRVRSAGAVPVP